MGKWFDRLAEQKTIYVSPSDKTDNSDKSPPFVSFVPFVREEPKPAEDATGTIIRRFFADYADERNYEIPW